MRTRWILAALVCLQLFLFGCAANLESAAPIQPNIEESAGDVLEIPSAAVSPFEAEQIAAHPTPTATPTSIPSTSPSVSPAPSATLTPEPTKKPTSKPTPEYDLENIKDTEGYIKAHDINVRKGPGTKYDKNGEIGYHTVVTITAKTDEWYQIETDDISGFVLKEFVGVGAIATSTPTPKKTPKPPQSLLPNRRRRKSRKERPNRKLKKADKGTIRRTTSILPPSSYTRKGKTNRKKVFSLWRAYSITAAIPAGSAVPWSARYTAAGSFLL